MNDEEAIARLEGSGQYKILKRLGVRKSIQPDEGTLTRNALFVDVETTGLDPAKDEVVQLAMVPFTFGKDGLIYEVGEPFNKLRQPLRSIPAEATAVHGITDKMVSGQRINQEEIRSYLDRTDLVIAHNARFDWAFSVALCEKFASKRWACSMSQIDWIGEGYETRKLEFLALKSGFFYDSHIALADCYAGIELLGSPLPNSNDLPMLKLLENACGDEWEVQVQGFPFGWNKELKARGYRFSRRPPDHDAAWTSRLSNYTDALTERNFIRSIAEAAEVTVRRIDAYDRFAA